MLKHFDHVTVAVTDPAAAISFFALLGFELDKDVVIKGPLVDQYMDRKLVFLEGPEGITVELAEWK